MNSIGAMAQPTPSPPNLVTTLLIQGRRIEIHVCAAEKKQKAAMDISTANAGLKMAKPLSTEII